MIFRNPLFKIPFRYGLVGGVIGGIAIAVLYAMDRHPFLFPVYLDFRVIIFAMFIFLGLKEVRDYHLNGYLYFWQGMIGSYVFIFTSALIGSGFSLAMATWNGNFLSSYVSKLQQQMAEFKTEIVKSVGQEAYTQQLSKLPTTTAWDLAGDYLLKSLIIGLFLAIILTVILRKQPKTQ